MTGRPSIVFVLNQLQDVNVARGLVYLAAREFDADIVLLASNRFFARDRSATWGREVSALAADTGASVTMFTGPSDLARAYGGRRGIVIAAGESDLSPHRGSHMALRFAPASFLKVTLQHGYECPGFLQSREHVLAHGQNVTFAADVVCTWAPPSGLSSMVASERSKVVVTGPPTILQRPDPDPRHPAIAGGLVCENLHSARLGATGDHGVSFLEAFGAFCAALAREGRGVTLRPHPGGQYVVKNRTPLPANVTLNNLPIWRVDLPRYAYGISAPSTVLLDMALAGIPVAVWRDAGGVLDIGHYSGLPRVGGADEWLAFERKVRVHRGALLKAQAAWLDGLGLVLDPAEVYRRFTRLIAAALACAMAPAMARPRGGLLTRGGGRAAPSPRHKAAVRRALFIANDLPLPTLEISFERPLAALVDAGEMTVTRLEERDLVAIAKGIGCHGESAGAPPGTAGAGPVTARQRIDAAIGAIAPEVVVFCRYGGAHAEDVVAAARVRRTPVVFHIDDDLLTVPRALGLRKYVIHNLPARKRTIRRLLASADLVYVSTEPLMERLSERLGGPGAGPAMVTGAVFASGAVTMPAELRPFATVGYMGFDHAHDLEMILPDLVAFLERNDGVAFELFGRIPLPPALERFGSRVRRIPPVRGYDAFMRAFAARRWDVGICPLQPTAFNRLKANSKWIEYTAVGAAVVASADMIYDACCADGCGVLVAGASGWCDALERLVHDPEARYHMVRRAQRRLVAEYGVERLRRQVLEVFAEACAIAAARGKEGDAERIALAAH